MRFSNPETTNCVICTCAGLHNELIEYDEIYTKQYIDYEKLEVEATDADVDGDLPSSLSSAAIEQAVKQECDKISKHEFISEYKKKIQTSSNAGNSESYHDRRKLLVQHFTFVTKSGLVKR
jgi:hypothetical protein